MTPDAPSRLQALLELWFDALERGERPRPETVCQDDPELLDDFRRIVVGEEDATRSLASAGLGTGGDAVRILGEFRLLRLLGRGGMGEVYLAEQPSLGRLVAVKILRTPVGDDPRSLLRFRREAEIAAALEHPHIVPVFAVGEDAGRAWIAMKWLQGPSLDALEAPATPEETARIGAAVARALHEAHLIGVIHRDVKPANVILDDGRPYVVDFGLARVHADGTLTEAGAVPGTLAYMSPEQIRGGRAALDPRSDVYSLGATLFEVMSGRPPFLADDPEVLVRQVLERDPPPPGLKGRHRDLETIVLRALEKERERRFFSAEALAEDLERYLRGEPIESRRTGVSTRTWRLVRRHRRASAIAGALLLVAGVFLALWLASVARDGRRFDDDVRELRLATDRNDLVLARSIYRRLSRANEGDRRLAELARYVAGKEALESLLDQIQDRRETQDPARLRRLLAALDDTDGARHDPRGAMLARAVAHLHLGENAEALRVLATVDPGRDVALLSDLAQGRDTGSVPASTASRAEEHVFAALALRIAGRSPEERLAEIERARALDPRDYRANNARAVWLAEHGDPALALEAFFGLLLTGRDRPAVFRNLSRQRMILGDLDGAAAELDRVPIPERGPVDALFRHEILLRSGRADQAASVLRAALVDFGDDAQLHMAAGRARLVAGDAVGARTAFERAASLPAPRVVTQDARAALLTLDVARLPCAEVAHPVEGLDADVVATLRGLVVHAGALADDALDAGIRAGALTVRARLQRVLGETEDSWSALEAALEADPRHPGPRVYFVVHLLQRVLGYSTEPRVVYPGDDLACGTLEELLPRARRYVRDVLASEGRGARPPAPREIEQCVRAELWFARVSGEPSTVEDCAARARALMTARAPLPNDAAWVRWIDDLLAWAEAR